jgi:hypothetical protein
VRTPEERIRFTNALAINLEDHILEGVANKQYAPNYTIEKNLDDLSVEAWVQRLQPVKKIQTTVTLRKPLQ